MSLWVCPILCPIYFQAQSQQLFINSILKSVSHIAIMNQRFFVSQINTALIIGPYSIEIIYAL